jgi:hypothetical protein
LNKSLALPTSKHTRESYSEREIRLALGLAFYDDGLIIERPLKAMGLNSTELEEHIYDAVSFSRQWTLDVNSTVFRTLHNIDPEMSRQSLFLLVNNDLLEVPNIPILRKL